MEIEVETFEAGHYEKISGYTYFVPTEVNGQWVWRTPTINKLLEKAAVKLGELNSFARLVPNIDLFIQLHVTKEAVLSSRIEGTKTNMDEAVLPEEEVNPEHRNDWKEVNNYVKALNSAIKNLDTLPISSRLLRHTHEILLTDARGEHKMPGEFRSSQNWIGGHSLSDATFIPPHQKYVQELMGDLENFLHNENIEVPELIRIAIAHYQFETIHPFLDGNGRIGRLLITLYLVNSKVLEQPLLYLSAYFEKNKNLYYDNLTNVRTKNDILQWLKYFLVGVEQTASKAVETLSEILKLKSEIEEEIRLKFGRRSTSGMILLQSLFKDPMVTVEKVMGICNLSFKASNDLVALFNEHKFLTEVTGQSRNRIFIFGKYLDVFKE